MNDNVNIASKVVEIAEHTTYLELTSRICYYTEANLNNDAIVYDDTSLDKAKTLINMPVQAKYRVNANGDPTLGGHEMVKHKDGSIEFKTNSIGTHTDVYIQEDSVEINGETKTLPCLFAKYRIWKRYENVVAAVRRLFSLGKLYGSWEINVYKYTFENGLKKIEDYEFLSNCLLGYEFSYPSYGENAVALEMAQVDNDQLLIAEALSQDLILMKGQSDKQLYKDNEINDTEIKEDNMAKLDNKNTNAAENIETPTDMHTDNHVAEINPAETNTNKNENKVDNKTEENVAQLTVWDTRRRIADACTKRIGKWCYIAYMFPNEKIVWCEYDGAETELDYVKFTYEVNENDEITVSEPEYVKLTVSIAEVNSKIAELNKNLNTAKAELELKNEAITKASEKIQSLNAQVSELTPYKDQVEAADKKRIENEIAEEKKVLREKMLKGNLFTEKDIAEEKITKLIEARNEAAINKLIADKFVASFDNETNDGTTVTNTNANSNKENIATASLFSDEIETDATSIMKKVLFN